MWTRHRPGQDMESQHFVFLLTENFSHLAFSCALEPLRVANLVSGQELYRWSLASEDGISATCSNRAITPVNRGLEPLNRVDRLFLVSGIHVRNHTTPAVINFLRRERAARKGGGGGPYAASDCQGSRQRPIHRRSGQDGLQCRARRKCGPARRAPIAARDAERASVARHPASGESVEEPMTPPGHRHRT